MLLQPIIRWDAWKAFIFNTEDAKRELGLADASIFAYQQSDHQCLWRW